VQYHIGTRKTMRNREKVMCILQEECAEVIQAVSKIYRFGMESEWQGVSNKRALINELGDLMAMIEILVTQTDININEEELTEAISAKKLKLDLYLPHET
jgi:NTP pyrophosphatase (non-canonical NTP hydrolase)